MKVHSVTGTISGSTVTIDRLPRQDWTTDAPVFVQVAVNGRATNHCLGGESDKPVAIQIWQRALGTSRTPTNGDIASVLGVLGLFDGE